MALSHQSECIEHIFIYLQSMSTDLISVYNKLYENAIDKIKSDQYEKDDLIDSPLDKRCGIALVLRPTPDVKQRILQFLATLQSIEPEQYYYPSSDIHITVMAIISCYEEFDINRINIQDYINVIQKCISSQKTINIHFKGVTASPSCVMIQGFPQQSVLNDLRNDLRTAFRSTTLEQTMDKRYHLQTAHATAVRFVKSFTAKEEFLQILDEYKDYDFGMANINEMEFVYNDWYLREKFVKTLFRFKV